VKDLAAIASFIIMLAAMIPYIVGVVKRRVVPERISWLLWMVLSATYFASAIMTGGGVLFTFGALLAPTIIFVLSIKYGVGGGHL
jgi:hypothetical protein